MDKKSASIYLSIGLIFPIILYVIAAIAIPYFIKVGDIATEYDENTSWQTLFRSNDQIKFEPIDSISYFGSQTKDEYKSSQMGYAADVTHLFPDYNAKKITLISDLYFKHQLQIWADNGSIYYVQPKANKHNKWIGIVQTSDSTNVGSIVLGRIIGTTNINQRPLDISGTYLNVYLILTTCILFICFTVQLHLNTDKIYGLILCVLLSITVGFLAFCLWNKYSPISQSYMIESVIALFCFSELGVFCTFATALLPNRQKKDDESNMKIQ